MKSEDFSLRRRTAVEIFRLGRELATIQDQLKAEGGWVSWLKERGISRTSAWEAMELFKRAQTEDSVLSLDVTTAKKRFGIVKDKPERRTAPDSSSPVREPSPPPDISPQTTAPIQESPPQVANIEAIQVEWVFTAVADPSRPDLPDPGEMVKILLFIYDEGRIKQIAAGLHSHLDQISRRRSRLTEMVIERVGTRWEEYDRECLHRSRQMIEGELADVLKGGKTEDEAVALVAGEIIGMYEPGRPNRAARLQETTARDARQMFGSSGVVDEDSVSDPEVYILDEREFGRAGIDLDED